MRIELRLRTALVILLVVLFLVTAGSVAASQLADDTSTTEHEDAIVTLDTDDRIWPYTSRSPSYEDATLSLNLLIYGDTEHTRNVLQDVQFQEWDDVDEDRQDIAPLENEEIDLNQSAPSWGGADGADRWIWVDPAGDDPLWLGEAYQLEDGDYLGHRHHIRAYEDPQSGNWTALQAHTEHWDWFHLRHTVHTIEGTQLVVEDQFFDRWFTDELHRERFGNDGSSDADGWVTVISLDEDLLPFAFGATLFGIAGLSTARARTWQRELRTDPMIAETGRALLVVLSIVVAYHAIRFGAIGIERQFPELNPKLIVATFYPILVIGMPILTYLSARKLEATVAFSAAAIGFVIAIFVDYTYLTVFRIPLETFIHRAALAVAIGMIAAGASQTARTPLHARGYVRTGVLVWLVAVLVPLLQFL